VKGVRYGDLDGLVTFFLKFLYGQIDRGSFSPRTDWTGLFTFAITIYPSIDFNISSITSRGAETAAMQPLSSTLMRVISGRGADHLQSLGKSQHTRGYQSGIFSETVPDQKIGRKAEFSQ